MRNLKLISAAVIGAAVALSGCSSTEEKPETIAGLPAWVMIPTVENGIAATECVPSTGDMSLDKAEATALARAELAKQIDLRVQAMDETYRRNTKTQAGNVTGGTFESVSKQVSDTYLQGARPVKIDYVEVEEKRNLCVMVAIQPEQTRELFENIVSSSQVRLDAQSRDVMWEEFKSYKAQQRLEEATQR